MKLIKYIFLLSLLVSCHNSSKKESKKIAEAQIVKPEEIKDLINQSLDNWHKAAAEANFNAYFDLMTKKGVFLGTDATENWQNEAFRTFSKPYFDNGKAWSFTSVERNIYLYKDNKIAWFDELLDTQMKLCRGSGVMKLEDGKWKIAHYVLSIAIPNENVETVVELKSKSDSLYLKKLQFKR
ncbi:nuclear transport factor 2 family protein [Lacinutrix sp. 5H-3-7-4]|uniref:nuclear transport factor 2 family protein n=1 Tax=Lacinutrix sp. (strain 5H-3-7-4) TaxID=983544 RepID=UPI00020A3B1F|nr:nuclear transport factor 2 family protein [Lacinutrix sp. 5H-3-7-4]AEH01002.1 hypothetical protein Lacal_1154 [Lacinutrix sp. 5H-3-7-4]